MLFCVLVKYFQPVLLKGRENAASGAAANRINVDAAAVAVLSEADGIFALKEEQYHTHKV